MKRICFYLVFGVLILSCGRVEAQSSNDNYVQVYRSSKQSQRDLSKSGNKDSVAEVTVYFDGLGREVQTVARQASPLGKDVVNMSTYNNYGKKVFSYLPYVANETNGALKINSLPEQISFYTDLYGRNDGVTAFSTSDFEHSELGRLSIQSAPGDAWKVSTGRIIKREYTTNLERDVLLFRYDPARASLFLDSDPTNSTSYYAAGQLTCTKVVDEEGNDVLEFVDKEGRTICKKVKAPGNVYACTYYVYDDFGNLVVVIPPEGVQQLLNTIGKTR